jgi:Calcineurin-like phosphoesterase
VLYLVDSWLSREHPRLERALKAIGLPSSAVQPGDFSKWGRELETSGVVGGDGTLFGTAAVAKYAQFDPGWAVSAVECVLSRVGALGPRYPFQHDRPKVLSVSGDRPLRIAIAGDWGAGPWGDGPWGANDHGVSAPSLLVVEQIRDQQPDVTIHLGDVYYGGTSVEEAQYLTELWYPGRLGSFTLNSNHEMFSGGKGYFETALDPKGVFGGQQQTSYFAIESDNWAIVGLDTAYFDDSAGFMDGALTDPWQIEFLRAFKDKQHLIVLTHHNALTTSGSAIALNEKSGSLWANVVSALDGRCPDFWFWGHVHNGIVYKAVPWDARQGPQPVTKCRCLGHGGLPFGRAYYLDDQPGNVEYFSSAPMGSPLDPYQSLRVRNGWAMLTIGPSSLEEEFWEICGTAPAWQQTHDW